MSTNISLRSDPMVFSHFNTMWCGVLNNARPYRAAQLHSSMNRQGLTLKKTVTRADLYEAVYQKVGLSRKGSEALVDLVLKEVADCLERGEVVKLSGFGSFVVRQKSDRVGRNPKTGEKTPIPAHRVMVFKPSAILKQNIQRKTAPIDGDLSKPAQADQDEAQSP